MSEVSQSLPDGWHVKTLGDICNIDPEMLSGAIDPNYTFRYIDIASVGPSKISDDLALEVFRSAPSRARKRVKKDDVLMATVRPNLKSFAKVSLEGELVASTGFAVLRAVKGKSHPEFLKQLLFSVEIERQVESLVAGSNYPAITVGNVRRLHVAVPPYDEQRGIAEVLSALDEQIEMTEREIEKSRRILDGLVDSLLLGPGRSKPLAYFAEVRPKTKGAAPEQLVPFVPMDAVTEDGHLPAWQVRPWAKVQSGFTRFASNDILVAKITPCFENGKGAHVPAGFDVWAGSTEFHVLRAKEGTNSRWLYWHTRSREFRQSGAGSMTGSAGQQRVPRSFIEAFPVQNLSEPEQSDVAASLDALDAVIQEDGRELAKLRLQKQGLMRDLLTGKVRVH